MTRLKISSATSARHFGPNNVVIRKYDAVIERIYFDCGYLSQSNRTKQFTFWKQQLKWKIRERGERKMEFFRQKERTKRNMVISIGSIHKKNKKYCWWNSTPFDLYIRNDSARHFFYSTPSTSLWNSHSHPPKFHCVEQTICSSWHIVSTVTIIIRCISTTHSYQIRFVIDFLKC